MKVVKLYRPAPCPGCGETFAVNNDRTIRWHWVKPGWRPCLESRDPKRVIAEPESVLGLW